MSNVIITAVGGILFVVMVIMIATAHNSLEEKVHNMKGNKIDE